MNIIRTSLLVLAVAMLSACDIASEVGNLFGSACSRYNGEKDSFSISMVERTYFTEPGATLDVPYEASWLDDHYRRQELDCTVDWVVSDEAIIELASDSSGFEVHSPGFATVTAVVTGRGGTKRAKSEIVVYPESTEEEPNNGRASANLLDPGGTHFGTSDYPGDVDFFEFVVPAGASYQIDVGPSVDLSESEYLYTYTVTARIYDDSFRIGSPHETYTNDSEDDVTLWVEVDPTSYTSAPRPYRVAYHLID